MGQGELAISAVTAVLAIAALYVSIYTYHGTLRSAARPVLIFSTRSESLWQIQNVGSGPALDLVVGDQDFKGNWIQITTCYPIAAGGSASLTWIRGHKAIAATYADVYGRRFTTVVMDIQNRITARDLYPEWKPDSNEWFFRWADDAAKRSTIKESQLKGLTAFQLDVMRNEPLARLGFVFRRADLQDYFKQQAWYSAHSNDLESLRSQLTPETRANMKVIQAYQWKHKLTTTPATVKLDVSDDRSTRRDGGTS